MKKFAYILILFITLVLTSCGVSSGHFKFEGKFLNMNQGEFYVYSPDGGFEGVDTIKVEGGRSLSKPNVRKILPLCLFSLISLSSLSSQNRANQ